VSLKETRRNRKLKYNQNIEKGTDGFIDSLNLCLLKNLIEINDSAAHKALLSDVDADGVVVG